MFRNYKSKYWSLTKYCYDEIIDSKLMIFLFMKIWNYRCDNMWQIYHLKTNLVLSVCNMNFLTIKYWIENENYYFAHWTIKWYHCTVVQPCSTFTMVPVRIYIRVSKMFSSMLSSIQDTYPQYTIKYTLPVKLIKQQAAQIMYPCHLTN